MAFFTTYSTR